MTASVEERVKKIIVEHLGVNDEKATTEATFDDLGADSLDCLELVMACEDEFDIEISDDEVMDIKTVGDMVKSVEGKEYR